MFNLRLALILALATLSGCETTDRPRFEDMSEYELVLHNALLPENEQIVCQEEMLDWRQFSTYPSDVFHGSPIKTATARR